MAEAIDEKAPARAPSPMTWESFRDLVVKARKGDEKALLALRKALACEAPEWRSWFLETYGDLASWLTESLIKTAVGKIDLALGEGLKMRLAQLRKDMEGPTPTPLEKLLAERAAVCWFTVTMYELIHAGSKELTVVQAKWQLQRINAAHERFLKAVATLARVRKLALPALQVNIARSQVNMT